PAGGRIGRACLALYNTHLSAVQSRLGPTLWKGQRIDTGPPRMSHVFGRDTRTTFPVAVHGEGLFLYDASGKQYLDASGGAAVSCLGHGHPAVREAIKRQVDRLGYAHTGYFTNEPQEQLADALIADAPS